MKVELKSKLRKLELSDFVDAIEEQESDMAYVDKSFDERIEDLAEYIADLRFNRLVKKLITNACFRFPEADIATLNFEARKIAKEPILNIINNKYIETKTNIMIVGPTGSGKTYLACAIAKEACKEAHRVFYIRSQDLTRRVEELTLNTKEWAAYVKRLSNYHVLIIDEWLTYKVSDKLLRFLYELFELRSEKFPTIFVTQYEIDSWHDRLTGDKHADSIMDRIMHNRINIESTNENLRKHYGKQAAARLSE